MRAILLYELKRREQISTKSMKLLMKQPLCPTHYMINTDTFICFMYEKQEKYSRI